MLESRQGVVMTIMTTTGDNDDNDNDDNDMVQESSSLGLAFSCRD